MTEDYIAISNTGKNITISMTYGMKQRICGGLNMVRLSYYPGYVCLMPCTLPPGYKLCARKSVWNVSVASRKYPLWHRHERVHYSLSEIVFVDGQARVLLPKPVADVDSMLRNLPPEFRREIPPPPQPVTPDAVPHEEPEMTSQYIYIDDQYFHIKMFNDDKARFLEAYKAYMDKRDALAVALKRSRKYAALETAGIIILGALAVWGWLT